jgi:hypothetical protein
MENPQTWGALEHTIADALDDHQKSMHDGRIGLSQVRMIADRLRASGFIDEDQDDQPRLPCNCRGEGQGCLRDRKSEECECLAGNCTC